jgi:hypothetical protein
VADYCGLVYRTGAIAEVNGVEATTTIFMHDYTSGRTGTVKVEIGSVIGLEITANGERCSECGEVTCSDGSTKYACDCSNIEDDAFITFCEDNLGITSTDSYFSILLLDVLTSCDVLGVEGEFTLYGSSNEDGDDDIDNDEEPEDDTVENDDIDENDDTDPDDDIQDDDNVDNDDLDGDDDEDDPDDDSESPTNSPTMSDNDDIEENDDDDLPDDDNDQDDVNDDVDEDDNADNDDLEGNDDEIPDDDADDDDTLENDDIEGNDDADPDDDGDNTADDSTDIDQNDDNTQQEEPITDAPTMIKTPSPAATTSSGMFGDGTEERPGPRSGSSSVVLSATSFMTVITVPVFCLVG